MMTAGGCDDARNVVVEEEPDMSDRVYAVQFSLTAPYDENFGQTPNLIALKDRIAAAIDSIPGMKIAHNTIAATVRTSPTCPECGGESPYHFAGCRRGPESGRVIEGNREQRPAR